MATEESLHACRGSRRELCAAGGNLAACAVPPDASDAIDGRQIVIVAKFVKKPA
jgi:hypothetical protein